MNINFVAMLLIGCGIGALLGCDYDDERAECLPVAIGLVVTLCSGVDPSTFEWAGACSGSNFVCREEEDAGQTVLCTTGGVSVGLCEFRAIKDGQVVTVQVEMVQFECHIGPADGQSIKLGC